MSQNDIFLFTEGRYTALGSRVNELREQIARLKKELQQVPAKWTGISNGDVHADPKYDHKGQLGIVEAQLRESEHMWSRARIVPRATSAEVVAIGVIVKIRRFNANKQPIGDAEEFFVDGHYHLDHEHGIRCAGYYAPLIEKLFELPVSTYTTMVDVEIGQTKFISLLEIRLPEASQVMDTVAA